MKNKIITFIFLTSLLCNIVGCSAKDNQITDEMTEPNISESTEDAQNEKVSEDASKDDSKVQNSSFKKLNDTESDNDEELKKAYGITIDEALLLIEEKFGQNGSIDIESGNEISYVFEDIQEVNNADYYNFKYSLLIYNENKTLDHISKVGNVFVSTDGEIVTFAEKNKNNWVLYENNSDTVLIFNMQPSGKQDAISCLVLNDDYTFTFTYDPYSSYLSYGKFAINDNKVVCETMDGLYKYVFDIVDDYNITFNEAESSTIEMIEDSLEKPKQGSLFTSE